MRLVSFAARAAGALLCGAAVLCSVGCQRPEFDTIIAGGHIVDGTGTPARRADVAIAGDRIAAIGDLTKRTAIERIDASGLVVAPGFIDVQGQSGVTLLVDRRGESHVRQGVTSEIIGEASSPALWTAGTADRALLSKVGLAYDWQGFDGYLRFLSARGVPINVGSFASINTLRRDVMGTEDRAPTPDELSRMAATLERAMEEGAFGLSSALVYPPGTFTTTAELVALARIAARHGGIYATHVRGESFRVHAAIREAIEIGERARVPVVIFHLKVAARQNWGRMRELGALIEDARRRGVEVSATMYPYSAAGTSLAAALPAWAQEGGLARMTKRLADPRVRRRIRREVERGAARGNRQWENFIAATGFDRIQISGVKEGGDVAALGRRITELARDRARDPWDVFFDLLVAHEGHVSAIYHMMSEEDVETGLRFPWVTIGSDSSAVSADGELGRGHPHPRAYGTFPRVLGHYVRERGVLSLEEAVHRMTGLAAAQMRIEGRGVVREGYAADLVIFDPRTIADRATFERPHAYPVGISHVMVNGVFTVRDGETTGAGGGRPLFRAGSRPAIDELGPARPVETGSVTTAPGGGTR